jgi:hypothetical protein
MYMWLCICVRLCEQTERVGVGEVVCVCVMCVCVYTARLFVYVYTQHDATQRMCARICLIHLFLQSQSLNSCFYNGYTNACLRCNPLPTQPPCISYVQFVTMVGFCSHLKMISLHTLTIGATQPESVPTVSDAALGLHTLAIGATRPPEDVPTCSAPT